MPHPATTPCVLFPELFDRPLTATFDAQACCIDEQRARQLFASQGVSPHVWRAYLVLCTGLTHRATDRREVRRIE